MEAVLEDNGLKDFTEQEVPKPATANAQELAEWKKCGESEEDSSGGSLRPYYLKSPWEGDSIFNVEDIEVSILEQQWLEETGAEGKASENQVWKGQHDFYISEQAHHL